MRYFQYTLLIGFLFLPTIVQSLDTEIKLHSHNDYAKPVPFWTAYNAGFTSIEIDVIVKGNQLFVAHDPEDITDQRTIENLYILPFLDALKLYPRKKRVTFLIDFKTDFKPTFKVLDSILKLHPQFKNNATIIISGKRPKTIDFKKYPEYILFDYQEIYETIKPAELEKVGMFSYNFKKICKWDGNSKIDEASMQRLKESIKMAHDCSKLIRFWGTPDTKKAWETLSKLGVDYINTDKTREAAAFFKK